MNQQMFNNKESVFGEESTKVPLSDKTKDRDSHTRFSNQIIKAELKELEFLRLKCSNLKETITFIKNENSLLKKQNNRLLSLNSQYLNNVNTLYEDKFNKIEKVVFPSQLNKSEVDGLLKEYIKRSVEGYKKLENDHRKLIKHCSVVQKQNKHLKDAVDQFAKVKEELLKVNHTDVYKLVREMKETEDENQSLRATNNQLVYQTEKLTLDINKIQTVHKEMEREFLKEKKEMTENRAMINKFSQEITEKENSHQRNMYQLQVKCDQLEKQLRVDQSEVNKLAEQYQSHQVEKVEFVHKQNSLMKTMREMASLLYNDNSNPVLESRLTSVSFIETKRLPRKGRGSRSLSVAR